MTWFPTNILSGLGSDIRPMYEAQLNVAHPLSTGLVLALHQQTLYDLNKGWGQERFTPTGTPTVTRDGISYTSNSNYLTAGINPNVGVSPSKYWTLYARVKCGVSNTTRKRIFRASEPTNGTVLNLDFADGTNNKISVGMRYGTTTFVSWMSATTPAANTWYEIIAYHDPADNKIYGIVNSKADGAPSEANTMHMAPTIYTVGSNTGTLTFNGVVQTVMLWDRCLSPYERLALIGNQYGMFKKAPRWMNLTSGGSTYTESLTLSAASEYGSGGLAELVAALGLSSEATQTLARNAQFIGAVAMTTTAASSPDKIAALEAQYPFTSVSGLSPAVIAGFLAATTFFTVTTLESSYGGYILASALLEVDAALAETVFGELRGQITCGVATGYAVAVLQEIAEQLSLSTSTTVDIATIQSLFAGVSLNTLAAIAQAHSGLITEVYAIYMRLMMTYPDTNFTRTTAPAVTVTITSPETDIGHG